MLLPKMDKALWWGLGSHARTRKLRDMLVDPHQIKGNTGVETEGGTLAKAELRHVGLRPSAPRQNGTQNGPRGALKNVIIRSPRKHTHAQICWLRIVAAFVITQQSHEATHGCLSVSLE